MANFEVTPEDVIIAAQNVVNGGKEKFTAKDVWYEVIGLSRKTRYYNGDAKIISNIFQKNEVKNHIIKLGKEFGSVMYMLR